MDKRQMEQVIEQLRGYLRSYVEQITEPSRGANKYICPLCGSGTGPSGTGAFSLENEKKWRCFACDNGGDLFDLIGKVENIPDSDFFGRLRVAGRRSAITYPQNGELSQR